jgi:hypothetical protein
MWLVPSGFPRVSKRTTTAMMMSATMPIPMYSGFIKLSRPGFSGVGLGVGDAAGGGDAFFSQHRLRILQALESIVVLRVYSERPRNRE